MILIVDDTPENIFSLKTLLQLNLYEVDTAASGEEALKKILKKDYELVILDVQMPGMDGYEVAENITGYSKTKDIPIILLSAVNIDKRFITKGYASGGVDYITKPFDPDLLLLKVKTFCRLYEQTRKLNHIQETLKEEIETRKQAQKALEGMNLLLEEKVDERTQELREMNKNLEISNMELQQYASLASHDLQEPLRKIVTFSNIVREKCLKNNEEANQYLTKVINATERMRTLINDLLNYSKLSITSPFIPADLNKIIAETLADLELSVKERKATVKVGHFPLIEAIPGQMRQVFQNIISNALKFSRKDIRPIIRIWGERVAERAFDAIPDASGAFLRIGVEDNGIGFNEEYLDKIFTIFQRLHGRSEYEGTGIGLAIVKKIIEKHEGIVTASSREGRGTTFTLVLPIKQNTTVSASFPHV
ncbi:MAG: hybrid sensor histidine kinase/response regulator [Flavisolibacter sp.]